MIRSHRISFCNVDSPCIRYLFKIYLRETFMIGRYNFLRTVLSIFLCHRYKELSNYVWEEEKLYYQFVDEIHRYLVEYVRFTAVSAVGRKLHEEAMRAKIIILQGIHRLWISVFLSNFSFFLFHCNS